MTSAILLSMASLPREAITLRINPPAGLIRRVRQETVFTLQGVKFTYRSLVEEEHQGIDGGAFSAVFSLKEGTLISPGSRVSMTDQPRTLKVSSLGVPLRSEGESPSDLRLRRLTAIPLPQAAVKVGDTWSVQMAQDGETVPELKSAVKLLALELVMGISAAKVSITSQEAGSGGASSSTTGWIDAATGLPIKLKTDLKKAPFAGGVSDGTWSMALQAPGLAKPLS